MATGVVFINNRNLRTDFGFVAHSLVGWPGSLASAPRDAPLLEGPEMDGAVLDPRLLRLRPNQATMTGRFETASIVAAMTALDALKAMMGEGEVRVRTVYAPDRECFAVLTTHAGAAYQNRMVNGRVAASFSFVVPAGLAFRTQPDGYALSTARTPCPIGTADVKPVIVIHGGGSTITDPGIIVRNAAGDPVQAMGLTDTGEAADFWRLDSAHGPTITKSVANVLSDGLSLWNLGDFVQLRVADAWPENAVWGTVELSAASGTPHGLISYTRAYK